MKKIKLLKELHQYLSSLPFSEFNYSSFLPHFHQSKWVEGNYIPPCGTTACVAGHAIILWKLPCLEVEPDCYDPFIDDVVAKFIGLSVKESDFLFLEHSERASKKDALHRLEWLIDGNDIDDYQWSKESWYHEDSIS